MSLLSMLVGLQTHLVLKDITLEGIILFSRLASHLKRDILQPQPIYESNPETAPMVLPHSISMFLATCIGVPLENMGDLWDILKDYIWYLPIAPLHVNDYLLFKEHGWPLGLTAITLYPPNNTCPNQDCPNENPLKKEYQQKAVVYTQAAGAQPAWNIHTYCPDCCTSYFNNYAVWKGTRRYYPGIPEYIQVGEHQYVESILIHRWRIDMLFGWFSASNLSREYEAALTNHDYFQRSEWSLSNRLTTNHVWDGFLIYSLLEDRERQAVPLDVPHNGTQAKRFKAAMQERNRYIVLNGQPDAVQHVCNRCMRVFQNEDVHLCIGKCQAIVGDGLSMGHPCCGIFRCRDPLANNRHRFCENHTDLHNVCAIVGCENPVIEEEVVDQKEGQPKKKKKKTCSLQLHQDIEKKHHERSAGSFLYKERLKHAQVSQLVDSFSNKQQVPEQDIQEDFETYSMLNNTVTILIEENAGTVGVADDTYEPCGSKSAEGNKTFKAQFGRRRTHNEQTLVRPCGVIFARATMFGAEAVSNFLVMVKNAFSVPGAQKPEHIFYDTNCDARQQAEKDPWFKGIGMCVDTWHFRNKHAVTHKYCQLNCNPAKYPELMDAFAGWFFNTSIAEQTNAWLGGYHSIVREMLPEKFNFFLDEMIRLRNIEVIRRLREEGHNPREY
ncbi:hypothetical protein BYT27DRAFT_7114765 [Phlegmacium glaucopus]|nr:hypothetical protein BYT27DRAFT_7114765 [Phlegmacium glaucopus]